MKSKHNARNEKKMRLIPLGGLGEFGRNMMVIEYSGEYLIIDCGILFPDNNMIGVDYIIPDLSFLQGIEDKIVGVILTHGHEDHIGGIAYLFNILDGVPIYATALTAGMTEVKLARAGLLQKTKINVKKAGDSFNVGSFSVELFHMTHSIPD